MRKRNHFITAMGLLGALGSMASVAVDFTWTGGATGNWTQPFAWTPAGPPNGPAARVFINDSVTAADITLNTSPIVEELHIGLNDSLTFLDSVDLSIVGDSIVNHGTVEQAAVSLATLLILDNPSVMMSGGGRWEMSGGIVAEIRAASPNNELINGLNHTIAGSGNIGSLTQLGIVNQGTIVNDSPTSATLTIQPGKQANVQGTFDLVNDVNGAIETVGSALTLEIRNADVLNNGIISRGPGINSEILVANATIHNSTGLVQSINLSENGALLSGETNGTCRSTGTVTNPSEIQDLVIFGSFNIQGPTIIGGTIFLPSLGDNLNFFDTGRVDPSSGLTINGPGFIRVTGEMINDAPASAAAVTFQSSLLVTGDAGAIGMNDNLGIINHGTIRHADISGVDAEFVLEPGRNANVQGDYDLVNSATGVIEFGDPDLTMVIRNADVLNDGVIQQSAVNSTMRFEESSIDNTNGTVRDVSLGENAELIGGTALGFCTTNGSALNPAVVRDITMPTSFSFQDVTVLRGTLTFPHPANSMNCFSETRIDPATDVVFTGDGFVRVIADIVNANSPDSAILTIGEDILIIGESASIGDNDKLGIINNGTIESQDLNGVAGTELVIAPGGNADAVGTIDFQNNGTLRSKATVDIVCRNQVFENNGTVEALADSAVIFDSSSANVLNQLNTRLLSGTWKVYGPIIQPARIELPGTPIQIIDTNAVVDLAGPVGRIVSDGVDLDDSLRQNRGTLRLRENHNFILAVSFENEGALEIDHDADLLSFDPAINVTLESGGNVVFELAGPGDEETGQINIAGAMEIAGELEIVFASGFTPTLGQEFKIIEAELGVVGAFTVETLPELAAGLGWEVNYNATDVTLAIVESAALLGDMNCDGAVTVSDIGPFVTALTDPAQYAIDFPACEINNADVNVDGAITVSDIGPFVTLLTGS